MKQPKIEQEGSGQQYYDVKTAAKKLDINPKTLYALVRARQIRCYRPGGKTIRFDDQCLDEFWAECVQWTR